MSGAACNLEIILEQPELSYAPGERIAGRIRVQVQETCRCKALWLRLFWSTIGEGNEESGRPDIRVLYQGIWLEGKTYDYPFQILAPKMPLSYNGKLFQVIWRLLSQVELADNRMGHGAEEILWIRAGAGPVVGDIYLHQDLFRWRESWMEALLLASLILCSIVVSVVLLDLVHLTWMGFLLDISMITAIPALLLFLSRMVGNRVALHRLGAVRVDFFSTRVRGGGPLELTLYFRPRRTVELNRFQATLRAEERVVQGKNFKKQHSQTVFEEPLGLMAQESLPPGRLVRLQARWSLPSDAPLTFRGKTNELRWVVRLHADIAGWPDWVRDLPIQVLPSKFAREGLPSHNRVESS